MLFRSWGTGRGGIGSRAHRGAAGRVSGLGGAPEWPNRRRRAPGPKLGDDDDGGCSGPSWSRETSRRSREALRSSGARRGGEGVVVAVANGVGGDGAPLGGGEREPEKGGRRHGESARPGRVRGGRGRCPGHLLLPLATSCFLLDAPVTPRASPTPSHLSLTRCTLSPSPDSLPRAHPRVAVAAVRHSRSHQPSLALPPVPEAPPLTSTPSPPSHTSGRALQRLPRPLLQASAAEIAGDRVPSLTPPRAPRGHRRNPCEPPVDSPLLPASISRPSHRCT